MFDLDGTLLGSIGLDSYTKVDSFDASTIDTAKTIATQLAINLQKLRLLRDSQQHAVRMQQITAFGQSVQATLQVANILEAALEYSERVLPASYLAIMPYDRAAQSLRMDARLYQGTSQITQSGAAVDMDENTVARAAWEERDLITIDDLQSNWEWKHPQSSELRAMMAVPLMARGLLMGIMEVGSEQPGAYDLTSAAAFQQMSNQIAVALANADAYARSQKVARNKAIASEIVAELQQQTEVEAILQVTARELGKALGAKRARIRLSAETDITRDPSA
jgi:GAF domain-containing protein